MPIHDQGYRRYGGSRAAVGRSWWVITREGLWTILRKRSFIALMLFAWGPFLIRAVQAYVAANFAQASFLAVQTETFREFLEQQGLFIFIVSIYAGAGLIANDRRANALQVYLSKPLTRAEYIAGKFAILFLLLASVTWLPAILLLLVQTMFAGNLTFVRANLFLFPAITLFALLQVLVSTLTMLALSATTKSSRFVGVMFAGVILFTAAVAEVLREITRNSAWLALSPTHTLDQLSTYIFRTEPAFDLHPGVAALIIASLLALSAWVLERRVRGVEVVT